MTSAKAALLVATILGIGYQTGYAQSVRIQPGISTQSAGLRATIDAISIERQMSIQVLIRNISRDRIYIHSVGPVVIALSNGKQLTLTSVSGIAYCRIFPARQAELMSLCQRQLGPDINSYDYIEPDDTLTLVYTYHGDEMERNVPAGTSLGFRIGFLARLGPSDLNSLRAPSQATALPQSVYLNFPPIALR